MAADDLDFLQVLLTRLQVGERALLSGGERSAHVRADTPVECLALTAARLRQLELKLERPALEG